jgi:hypothetical protein
VLLVHLLDAGANLVDAGQHGLDLGVLQVLQQTELGLEHGGADAVHGAIAFA